jgi:hypothetical protein
VVRDEGAEPFGVAGGGEEARTVDLVASGVAQRGCVPEVVPPRCDHEVLPIRRAAAGWS